MQVRDLSQQYSLPDPIQIMISPPLKRSFKVVVKTAITSFWSVVDLLLLLNSCEVRHCDGQDVERKIQVMLAEETLD